MTPHKKTKNTKTVTNAALPARDAFAGLLNYVFRLDITDRQRLQEEFNRLSRVVTLTRFCSLTFPRDLARLPAVREAILAHLT
jgi:hypothetical protein